MLRSQRYSALVFDNVETVAKRQQNNKKDKVPSRYKGLCKRAGGILRTVGLIQFMAFIEAKGARETHYEILGEHLSREFRDTGLIANETPRQFLESIRRMNLPTYMNTTRAALQLLQWHKRIAEILIEGTADDQSEED